MMKRRIKIVLSCMIVICIIAFVIDYVGRICVPEYTGDAFNTIEAFHNLPEDSVEVMVYGSSHAWKGLNCIEMYENYGIGAYNYGCNWQHINTTSLFFEDSLRTQSPKVILVETYLVNDVLSDIDMNGEIYYTRGISHFDAKSEYLEECFGNEYERYLSYYVPFVAFHSNWKNISRWSFANPTDSYDFTKSMGYLASSKVVDVTLPDYRTFEQKELCEKAIKVLDNMVKICRENDIEIIFYTVPYAGEYCYFDAMKEYAEENGCKYINLFEKMDEMGFDSSTDFQDAGHLNDSGARKVAKYLGKYISENYEVTDMRKIENNLWENN